MHPRIAAFPSSRFYGGRLRTAASILQRSSPCCSAAASSANGGDNHDAEGGFGPWALWDVAHGREQRDKQTGSLYNEAEAEAVVRIVRTLHKRGIDAGQARSLRVLTFYAAQVNCVRRALARADRAYDGTVSVGTVDGAQGAESDLVILSFVRANAHAGIGFVDDWRRLNVAITRARHSLLMVGHVTTLGAGEVGDATSDLVRHAAKTRAIHSLTARGSSADDDHAPRVERAPVELTAAIVAAAGADEHPPAHGGGAGAKKRRRAQGGVPLPTAGDEPAQPPAGGAAAAAAVGAMPVARDTVVAAGPRDEAKRRIMPARSHGAAAAPGEATEDADTDYLASRAAEIAAYVRDCQRADAEKAERRLCEERAAKAVFAPPNLYSE